MEHRQVDSEVVQRVVDLVEECGKLLVDKPELVRVTKMSGETQTVIFLGTDQVEMGKIIGKNGRTITGLRAILQAISGRIDHRIDVETEES